MLKTLIKIRLQGILLRQTTSSKKKGSSVGKFILYGLLFAYLGVVFIGMFGMMFYALIEPLQIMGIEWLYFALMALFIVVFCFIGSIFLTHHEIYEAKDNELLLSMPIKNRDVLLSRVFTILILNYVYEALIALPAFYVYITNVGMNLIEILMFIGVCLTLPLFVLAISCLFSWILAHVLVKIHRFKTMISVVLFVGAFGLYMYAVNSIQTYMTWLLENGKTIAEAIESSMFPLYHLSLALSEGNVISFIIYLLCAVIPFVVAIYILSVNFIKMATTKPKVKKAVYKAKPMKQNSLFKALIMREVKHFTSNAMVMLNGAMGIVLCVIAAIFILFYKDEVHMIMTQLPQIQEFVTPVLCLIVIGTSSLNMISASSISLEGDRFWIIKSLPIASKDILNAKLAMHFLLCVLAGLLLSLVLIFVTGIGLLDGLIVLVVPILFTLLIDFLGLILNLWRPKFDWVNETVCVKQSLPVTLTMFISMGIAILLVMVYAMLLVDIMSITVYMYSVIMIVIILDVVLYQTIQTWGIQQFEHI